jgi:hypothetical protein
VGGAEIQIVRRLRVSLDVATGRLPAQEGGDLDRDFGEAALELIVPITSWLGTRTGVVVRSYSSDIARTRQTMLRLGGEARFGLVEGVVQGALRFAYLPGVWVDGLDAPNLAFTSSAILDYALGPGRVRFSYSLERLDYPASGGASRDEQLSGLWLGFMLPFGAPGVRGNR